MSITEPDQATEFITRAGQRLAGLDPLLPSAAGLPPGCGVTFTETDSSGAFAAIGGCRHFSGEPGSLALTWGAAHGFRLIPHLRGSDLGASLDSLIAQWRDHLAGVPEAAEDDSAAIVTWPSRDVRGIRTLQRHGLIPLTVIAARVTRPGNGPDRVRELPGVSVRRAGPADAGVVTSRGLDLVRYDEQFGNVRERPHTRSGLAQAAAELLAHPDPWVWLAERDGTAVGLLTAESPEIAGWIAPLTGLAPAAYLQQLFVLPGERGTGIGALLTSVFHAEIEAAGVAVTLLHHGQVNPLSAPFWCQQGYRPLWTSWEARPARTLR